MDTEVLTASSSMIDTPTQRVDIAMNTEPLSGQPGKQQRYYTADEVSAHNSADDAWFIVYHKVLNLTDVIATTENGSLTQALVINAGRDISHWFDSRTMDLKSYYNEQREIFCPYLPMGRFVHVLYTLLLLVSFFLA